MSDNLPEQMHAPRSTAVAAPAASVPGAFDLDGQDIRLPRLKVGQTQTPSVIERLVEYGDVFIQRTRDDAEPTILQRNGELGPSELSDPIRFYVHGVRRGVNFRQPGHPDANSNGMVLGPWNVTVLDFIEQNPAIDPTEVYRKYDYTLTVPEYQALPVMFLMASSWGGPAASDLNTQIQLLRNAGSDVTEVPFRVQFKGVRNDKGAFMKAFVGIADVSEGDKETDLTVVRSHKLLLPHAIIEDEDGPTEGAAAAASAAPSIA